MNLPIIIITYSGMEQFIPDSINHLDNVWPDHGDIYIISDNINNHSFNCKKTYRCDNDLNWLGILYHGLLKFQKDFKNIKNVYLMLEDLIPLEKINVTTINLQEKIFESQNWKYLYFPHYENNFEFELSFNENKFTETPNDWLYYSQIGVSLVAVTYMISLCENALERGFKTPWEFEFIKSEEKHYISAYKWPTVRDGYFRQKYVNYDAIKFLNNGQLKQKLLLRYFIQLPKKNIAKFVRVKTSLISFLKKNIKNFNEG